jgi:hypothetical protein
MTLAGACSLIAGLEDHRALPDGFPDSPSVPCSDGTKLVACAGLSASMHQDGSYQIAPPVRSIEGDLLVDAVTGLSWWRVTTPKQTWGEAGTLCASLDIAGLRGFRLPSRLELVSLLDVGATPQAWLDAKAFTDPGKLGYWSTTPGGLSDEYRVVYLGCAGCERSLGVIWPAYHGSEHDVLCVHGDPYEAGPFVKDGDFMKDTRTKLVWIAAVDPMDTGMNWPAALAHCENLTTGGKQDWRLPSIKELVTILDPDQQGNSSLVKGFSFPGSSATFWSSTPDPSNPMRAFSMLSTGGSVQSDDAVNTGYYRALCVRGPEP